MHVANCEYQLLSISCEMNADQSLFVVEIYERRSNSANLVWSSELYLNNVFDNWRFRSFVRYINYMYMELCCILIVIVRTLKLI